ncbi:MAG: hypothetical protein GY801_46220 [bacterium]|nr:hypothetical protein [bacterium]
MQWVGIRRKYPDTFILLGNLVEEKISETKCRIIAGDVLQVSDDAKEIREAYQRYTQKGKSVIYALPGTPEEFIVEDVPFMGLLR